MTTNTTAPVENFSDMLKLLESVGLSSDKVAEILAKADNERAAVAEANKVLEAKAFDADQRSYTSLDELRDMFFNFAESMTENIVVTAGDPNGGNKNTRADRRQIEIPTPSGTLNVRLTHN